MLGLVETVQVGSDLYSTFYNPSGYTACCIPVPDPDPAAGAPVDWQIKRQEEKFQRGIP